MFIGIGVGIQFSRGGSQSWDTAINYVSALTVLTTSASEQTVTATIAGTDYDGVSFEYSTDYGINWTVAGTAANGIYSATGLSGGTLYYWRARLYKGSEYGDYSNTAGDYTSVNANLIAGWKFDRPDYFINQLSDLGFSDSMNSHSAIYYNGKTYITFCGIDRTVGKDANPYIITYTHATGVWSAPVKIGDNPLLVGDLHGCSSMLIDSSGYIHLFWGAHNTDFMYSKSDNPEDISAWTAQPTPATGTYPQAFQFSNGDIYLFYRRGNGIDMYWSYKVSSDGGANWGAYVTLTTTDYAYAIFRKGIGDVIHCVITEGTSDADRTNINYLYFNGTNWKDVNGTNLTIPLVYPVASILAYDSAGEWITMPHYTFDDSNNVKIVFTEGHDDNPPYNGFGLFSYKFLKHNGTAWVSYSMGVVCDRLEYAGAVEVIDDDNIDAYIIAEGLTDTVGGDVIKMTSQDGGETWNKVATIKEGKFLEFCKVINYHEDAMILFDEYRGLTTLVGKGYLWGKYGFVKNNSLSPSVAEEIKGLYNGTLYNTPVFGAGKYDYCYSFLKTSARYIGIDDNDVFSFNDASADKPFSISCWINVPSTAGLHTIISKLNSGAANEYSIYLIDGVIYWTMYTANAGAYIRATAPFTSINDWYFICVTYDGSRTEAGLKIYIDLLESQTVQTQSGVYTGLANTAALVNIGRRSGGADLFYLTGSLDEVKIWDKVLSSAEMTALMANTL